MNKIGANCSMIFLKDTRALKFCQRKIPLSVKLYPLLRTCHVSSVFVNLTQDIHSHISTQHILVCLRSSIATTHLVWKLLKTKKSSILKKFNGTSQIKIISIIILNWIAPNRLAVDST